MKVLTTPHFQLTMNIKSKINLTKNKNQGLFIIVLDKKEPESPLLLSLRNREFCRVLTGVFSVDKETTALESKAAFYKKKNRKMTGKKLKILVNIIQSQKTFTLGLRSIFLRGGHYFIGVISLLAKSSSNTSCSDHRITSHRVTFFFSKFSYF